MAEAEQTWRFGNCELDTARRELRVGGHTRNIEPKAFDLLVYLIQKNERVVGHDELLDNLWPGVIVTEAALSRTIMKARKAVADETLQQEVIKTVPKRGYRFVARLLNAAATATSGQGAEPANLSAVSFVQSEGLHIAWRYLGEGSPDMLFVPGFVSHLDMRYRIAPLSRFDEHLAANRRLISFDKRGMGLSERVGYPPTIQNTVTDMLAVLDAAEVEKAILFGVSEGGPATALFAAEHPERTAAVIMYGAFAKGVRSKDYPWARSRRLYDAWLNDFIGAWGEPASLEFFAPNIALNPQVRDEWSRYLRSAATPGSVRSILEALRDIDVRPVLPKIQAPTLVLHRRGDLIAKAQAGEDIAARIPDARFKLLEGNDHWWFVGDSRSILEEIDDFLDSLPAAATN